MASSSSLRSEYRWNHDVFLSFRGPDTRNTFLGHLHQALLFKGINVFIDTELQRGEVITSQLLKLIEESRISIVVLSEKYASSSFCLDELEKILESRESKGQTVFPVFYHVDPTDVEEQRGTFGQEFAKLEAHLNKHLNYWLFPSRAARFLRNVSLMWPAVDDLDEQINNDEESRENIVEWVKKWRLALTKVARLSGWHLTKGDNESNMIQDIVKKVWKKLNYTPLHVAEYPVGLSSRVEYILKELNRESQDVCILGLHGMGGVGKTTTAAALYNTCAIQFEFEGSCFLSKVREESKKHGIAKLQQTLLFEILGDQAHKMNNSIEGIELIKRRLRNKKVLIVIDDVDHREQLQHLVGGSEWFGGGSIIIITTRNSHLLKHHGVTMVHEINELEFYDALKLFSWYAFKEPQPDEAYMEFSSRVISYTRGLPLALKVLGSSLYKRSAPQWEDMLEKLKRVPNEIDEVLKVSYDNLDREEKTIFLDIAFFFKGKDIDEVAKFLDVCGFGAHLGIERLIENSLVYIDYHERLGIHNSLEATLGIHDLLESMGTKIALEESSRLCIHEKEDILRLFVKDKKAYDVEILVLDLYGEEEVPLNWLQNLTKLRILVILNGRYSNIPKKLPNSIRWLEWRNCCLMSIPFGFLSPNLVVLEMPYSNTKKFLTDIFKAQKFINLTHMNLSESKHLREMIIDFLSIPNMRVLNLSWCEKLKKIHKSLGSLKKLEELNLWGCCSLTSLPNLLDNQCLKFIYLFDCSNLENLPKLRTTLTHLYLENSGIKKIPLFNGNLIKLKEINAPNCKNFICVPDRIYKLFPNTFINLHNCSKLPQMPESESSMFLSKPSSPMLEMINLSRTEIVSFSINTCINPFNFIHFKVLILDNCERLVEIQELPHTLRWLRARNCKSLVRFSQFQFDNLFEADFSNCHKKLGENEKKSWTELVERKEVYPCWSSYNIILPGNEIPEWFSYSFNCDASYHFFRLPSSLFNPNLIIIASSSIFQPPTSFTYCEVVFSMNDFTIYSGRLNFPMESEHMWLSFRYVDFDFPKLLEAEEILCEFHCYNKEVVLKRVGVHFIYKN